MNTELIDKIIKDNPILSSESQLDLVKKWQESKDKAALDKVILSNMRIVTKEAYRFKKLNKHLSYGDLVQEGMAGLLKAAGMFDPERGVGFLTYAMWWVRVNMRQHVMRHRSIVRLGGTQDDRILFSSFSKTSKIAEEKGLIGRDKTMFIAKTLSVKPSSVEMMRGSLRGYDVRLDTPVGKGEDSQTLRVDLLPDERTNEDIGSAAFDHNVMSSILRSLIDKLPEEEKKILKSRRLCEEPRTLRDLAKDMGISREWVREIESRAISRLKKRLASEYGIREF
jgi:RNA polymerase sigma-32 factor